MSFRYADNMKTCGLSGWAPVCAHGYKYSVGICLRKVLPFLCVKEMFCFVTVSHLMVVVCVSRLLVWVEKCVRIQMYWLVLRRCAASVVMFIFNTALFHVELDA